MLQTILEEVPGQLKGIFKALDNALALQLVQRAGFLFQRFAQQAESAEKFLNR